MLPRTLSDEIKELKGSIKKSPSSDTVELLSQLIAQEALKAGIKPGNNEPVFVPCFKDANSFEQFMQTQERPSSGTARYYIPLSLSNNHFAALIVDINAAGEATTLFFDPLGGKANDPYHKEAQLYIAALNKKFTGVGQDYQTTKAMVKESNYSGDSSLWFLKAATSKGYDAVSLANLAKVLASIPEKDFPDPVKLRQANLRLLEQHQANLVSQAASRKQEEQELQLRPFNYKHMVNITTEGNNCPVYCIAQYLISELIKDPAACAFKANRAQVISSLVSHFNQFLDLKLKDEDLVPLLKAFDDQHPMVALNTLSDVLIAAFLNNAQRDVQNMMDDEIFTVLGESLGFEINLYNNPAGVNKDSEGLQIPKDNEILLRPLGSYGERENKVAAIDVYHLADDSNIACGFYLNKTKIKVNPDFLKGLPTSMDPFSAVDSQSLVSSLPLGSKAAYVLVQEAAGQLPTALIFVDRRGKTPVIKLLKDKFDNDFLRDFKRVLDRGKDEELANIDKLSNFQLNKITTVTNHSLERHLHFNLLLQDESRVSELNNACDLRFMTSKPSLANLPPGRNNAYIVVQSAAGQLPTELYFVDRLGKTPKVELLRFLPTFTLPGLLSTLFPLANNNVYSDLPALSQAQVQAFKENTDHDLASLGVRDGDEKKGNDLEQFADRRKLQLEFKCSCFIAGQRMPVAGTLFNQVATLLNNPNLDKMEDLKSELATKIAAQGEQLKELVQLQEKIKGLGASLKVNAADLPPNLEPQLTQLIAEIGKQQVAGKLIKPLPSPTASSSPTVTVTLTPPPARTGVKKNPAQLLAEKIFNTTPAAGIAKSEYEFFKAETLGEINQVIRQVQPALSPDPSLIPPPSSATLAPVSEGSVRVGKHTLPRGLENNSLKLKKFTVLEFNKTAASVDSKLIFEKEALELMKSKNRFTDLTPVEKKILLAVVDKQIEDSLQALRAAGRSVTLTLNEKMSPLIKDAYEEYCRAMGYKLKDVDKATLVTGKEVPQGLQASKASIVEYRAELSEMIKKENKSGLTPI